MLSKVPTLLEGVNSSLFMANPNSGIGACIVTVLISVTDGPSKRDSVPVGLWSFLCRGDDLCGPLSHSLSGPTTIPGVRYCYPSNDDLRGSLPVPVQQQSLESVATGKRARPLKPPVSGIYPWPSGKPCENPGEEEAPRLCADSEPAECRNSLSLSHRCHQKCCVVLRPGDGPRGWVDAREAKNRFARSCAFVFK